MAHESARKGGVSELLAAAMLLKAGYNVFDSLVPEAYDLVIIDKDDEGKNRFATVQVKTIKTRNDRNGELVVKGAPDSGIPYSANDVNYLFGIHQESGLGFLIPNAEQTEYWSKDLATAAKKWKLITTKETDALIIV